LTDEYILVKNNLAFLYWKMGNGEKSIEIVQQTLEIINQRKKSPIDVPSIFLKKQFNSELII
jgi:hypothetical protein